MKVYKWYIVPLCLLMIHIIGAQASSLNIRVTTDHDLYIVGQMVHWTMWIWVDAGQTRGVALLNASLNDSQDEILNKPLVQLVGDRREFVDSYYNVSRGFDVFNAGEIKDSPPRLQNMATGQVPPQILDVGNDGTEHIYCRGSYQVTKIGEHILLPYFEEGLYWTGAGTSTQAFASADIESQNFIVQTPTANLNGDQIVNWKDFSLLSTNWGHQGSPSEEITGDLNNDGNVNSEDIINLAQQWLISDPVGMSE